MEDAVWLRNHVGAPVTEELVFRGGHGVDAVVFDFTSWARQLIYYELFTINNELSLFFQNCIIDQSTLLSLRAHFHHIRHRAMVPQLGQNKWPLLLGQVSAFSDFQIS